MLKILEKKGASGSMNLSYIWEEDQSGVQNEYMTTVTLKAAENDCVTMREEVQVNDRSCRGQVSEYDIGVDELIKLIKEHGKERRI